MTKTPHKHADLIKQWADGAQIQLYDNGKWQDMSDNRPFWSDYLSYRVKPEKPKYRVGEFGQVKDNGIRYLATVKNEDEAKAWSAHPNFVRWISDWVEYDA